MWPNFRYLKITVADKNNIHGEVKSRINLKCDGLSYFPDSKTHLNVRQTQTLEGIFQTKYLLHLQTIRQTVYRQCFSGVKIVSYSLDNANDSLSYYV
jgi:hypothetical protein